MNSSSRHHYLPVFYLNGFTNENGAFAIFNKKKNSKATKFFVPKSHFFEWDRNTILINGESTSFIEDIYSMLDTICAPTFIKLQSNLRREIEAIDMIKIGLFIKAIFWRNPNKDNIMDNYLDSLPKESLKFKISDNEGNEAPDDIFNSFFKDKNFRQAYRASLAFLNYEIIKNEEVDDWKFYFSSEESFHLCGDVPIIYNNWESDMISNNDFILPLTKSNLLIHKKGKRHEALSPELRIKLDILIFLQAEKYVCSKNMDYLNSIAAIAKTYDKEQQVKLKNEIFESI